MPGLRLALCALLAAMPVVSIAAADEFPPEFRTLGLGQTAAELDTEGYEYFACGSNGGPPKQQIGGWTDFMECRPEASGLREVYVEFGRRIGQLSQMFRERYEDELWIQKYGGTRMANYPVVLSLLFDEEGVVRGFRAITDDRAPNEDRGRAYLFRFSVFGKYGGGASDWNCIARDPAPGQSPVGTMYLNEVCTRTIDGRDIRVEAHFFRKPGQTGMDSFGMFEEGQYESLTRWEVYDSSLGLGGAG